MLSNISVWFHLVLSIIASILPDLCLAVLNNFTEKRQFRLEYEKMKKERNFDSLNADNPTQVLKFNDNNSNNNNNNNANNGVKRSSRSRRRFSIHKIQDINATINAASDFNNNNNNDQNSYSFTNNNFSNDDFVVGQTNVKRDFGFVSCFFLFLIL